MNHRMPAVYYVTRFLPDYRRPILEELDRRLGGRLVLCFGDPPGGSAMESLTSASGGDPSIHLPNIWIAGERLLVKDFRPLKERLREGDVVLLEESPRIANQLPFMRWCKRRRVRVVLWGHFSSNNRRFNPRSPADRYRLRMARIADACIAYTDETGSNLTGHIPANRVFVANNTMHSDSLIVLRRRLEEVGRDFVRREFGAGSEHVMIAYVGRLIAAKGIDVLYRAVVEVVRSRRCVVAVVGDGPERAVVEAIGRLDGVSLVWPRASTDLEVIAPLVFAADAMVMPGYAGLSINLALLLGTPVVAVPSPDDSRYHSPEIAFLKSEFNGEVAADRSPEGLAAAILRVAQKHELYSRNAVAFAERELTTDRMVTGITDAIDYVT